MSDTNSWVDVFGLENCGETITKKASKWQGKGHYPGVDNWKMGRLKKGDIIYGGVPGQSEFYLSKVSIDAAKGSKEALWKSAQVKAHDVFGYRSKIQKYEVLEDIDIASSIVRANPHLGKGGAVQYFVDNFRSVLKPIDNPINLF